MTSDGIAPADWDDVHDAALEVANASDEDVEHVRRDLVRLLDELELRYGRLPSLLATRADYTDDDRERELLYLEAFELAKDRNDSKNVLLISHSLAQLYIERFRDRRMGQLWLAEFRKHWTTLGTGGDEAHDAELTRALMALPVDNRDRDREP